jgi:hypothetical protein
MNGQAGPDYSRVIPVKGVQIARLVKPLWYFKPRTSVRKEHVAFGVEEIEHSLRIAVVTIHGHIEEFPIRKNKDAHAALP